MTIAARCALRSNAFSGGAAVFPRPHRPGPRLGERRLFSVSASTSMIDYASRRSFGSSSSSPSDGPDCNASSKRGGLRAFASDWNETLSCHPQTVLASFLSAQCTTWLGLYASLSATGIAMPPSLAAGWAVAKFSKKFRQPVHAALAAILVRAFPVLGEVKVTPLVTGLVMGAKDKEAIAKQMQESAPGAMPVIDKVAKGAKWLEGPVDRYGLSYYLSSRVTGVSTICISAYLVHQGVDVGAYLSSWGAGVEGVGEAVGTAAAAAVLNVFFVPLHFYSSVYGVRFLEGASRAAARNVVDAKIEAEDEFRQDYERSGGEETNEDRGDGSEHQKWDSKNDKEESDYREKEYERISDGAIRSATLLLLAYSLAATLYSLRLMGETATATKSDGDGDER